MKKISVYSVLVIYVLVSGCVSIPNSGKAKTSSSNSNECNNIGAAIVGGVVGALAGGKKNRVSGAAIGAAVASLACIAVNSYSQQTASAEEVNRGYKAQNNSLPSVPTIIEYKASAPKSVQKGTDLKIQTLATVVDSQSGSKAVLTETIELTPPENQKGPKTSKVLSENGGGTFTQNYSVPLPKEIPGGIWSYKSTLYLDGKLQKITTGNFIVV
jgi:hypothetical protein